MNAPLILHDRYRIEARLGQSRLAIVYRALDERLNRPVLVHLLRPELLGTLQERFTQEAARAAQRSHPGLLEVYDTGEVGGRPFMITADVAGQPVIERVPLSMAQAIAVVRTVAGAVALAQSEGSPHPPISSRNIWALDGGRTVLLENWLLLPAETAFDLAHYRAPERAGGQPPTPATPVYALGVLLWECLVGRRPFTGTTVDEISRGQASGDLPPLTRVLPRLYSPELERIVAQATAGDPRLRYPTVTDFGRALDLYVDGITAPTGRLAMLQRGAQAPPGGSQDTQLLVAAAPATFVVPPVNAPPPQPVLRPTRRVRQRVVQPPQQSQVQPATPALDPQELAKVTQLAVRKELRRQSIRRAATRWSLRLGTLIAILLLIYFGGRSTYLAADRYVTGQLQRLQPGQAIARQLPNWQWLDRLLHTHTPVVPLTTTYLVQVPLRLREAPTTGATIIRELPKGTVLRWLGERQTDDKGQEWIKVLTTAGIPQQGWVANLPGALVNQ